MAYSGIQFIYKSSLFLASNFSKQYRAIIHYRHTVLRKVVHAWYRNLFRVRLQEQQGKEFEWKARKILILALSKDESIFFYGESGHELVNID